MNDVPANPQLLLHPVRMRIVVAFVGAGTLTPHQLRSSLGNVPPATLYRHIGVLAEAGVLDVVGERRIRGAVERTYALRIDRAMAAPADLATATPSELMTAFTTFVATLLADYAAFARRADRDAGDTAYFVTPLELTDEQFAAFGMELQGVLKRAMATPPSATSRRRTLATIVLPDPSAQGDLS